MTRFRPAVLAATLALSVGSLLAASMSPAAAAINVATYAGPVVAIPDSPGPAGTASLAVSGVPRALSDLNLTIGGSACNTTSGSTTVGIDHTFTGDLRITLISPAGTRVPVFVYRGGGGNNLCQTVFDDEAGSSISTGVNPFTGSFIPESALSAFDGEDPNGTWTLEVDDDAGIDVGSIRAWSLSLDSGRRSDLYFTSSRSTGKVGSVYYPTAATGSQNSGAPIVFSVSPTPVGACTLSYTGPKSSPTVTFVAAGTCVVRISQQAGGAYGTTTVTQSIAIS